MSQDFSTWNATLSLARFKLTAKQKAEQVRLMRDSKEGAVIVSHINTQEIDCHFWTQDIGRRITVHRDETRMIDFYDSIESMVEDGWVLSDSPYLTDKVIWVDNADGWSYPEIDDAGPYYG